MNFSDILNEITFFTGADKGNNTPASFVDYPITDRTAHVNNALEETVTEILDSQDGWDWDDTNNTDYPIATTNLVANQQDYSFPASLKILKIKRVEVCFDGVNWKVAQPFDISQRQLATDTTSISNDFSTLSPFYDPQANSVFLYPIPATNVTGGLKVWFSREPSLFITTDTTKIPGIDTPWHSRLSMKASLKYAVAKNLPHLINTLKPLLDEQEMKMRVYYGSKEKDRKYQFTSAYNNNTYGR